MYGLHLLGDLAALCLLFLIVIIANIIMMIILHQTDVDIRLGTRPTTNNHNNLTLRPFGFNNGNVLDPLDD